MKGTPLLAGLALLAAALAAGSAFSADGENGPEAAGAEEIPGVSGVFLDEDDVVTSLMARAERSVAEGNIRGAVEDYVRILEQKAGSMVSVDGRLYRCAGEVASSKILALPPEGLRLYRLLCDPHAEACLREWTTSADEAALNKLRERYFASSFGDEGLHAAACIAYDAGNFDEAAWLFRKVLEEYPDPSMPKEALRARLVSASARAGRTSTAEEAARDLPEPVVVGGRRLSRREFITAFSARGTGDAGSQGAAPKARLSADTVRKWLKPIPGENLPQREAMRQQMAAMRTARGGKASGKRIVTSLVSDGKLVFTARDEVVYANHLATFAESWKYPEKTPSQQPDRFGGWGWQYEPVRTTSCALEDGRLYAALGPFPNAGLIQQMMFGGARGAKITNRLVCLRSEDGHLVWDSSNANAGEVKAFLDESFFVTTPTVSGGCVYAVAATGSSLRDRYIVAFSAATGEMLWKRFVASGGSMAGFGGMPGGAELPSLALSVTVETGVAYAATNCGAVAAIEASRGTPRWIRVYEKGDDFKGEGARNMGFQGGGLKWVWYPAPPMVSSGRLYVAPQDTHELFAIDASTGVLVWTLDPKLAEKWTLRYVLGLWNGLLVLSGESTVALDASSGALKWVSPVASAGPGFLTGSHAVVPTAAGATLVDLATGKVAGSALSWASPDVEAGGVFPAGDILLAASDTHVSAYFDAEELIRRLRERAAKESSPVPNYELGAALFQQKRYDKAVEAFKAARAAAEPGRSYEGVKVHEESGAEVYRTFVEWARSLREAGNTPDAVARFRDAASYAPGGPEKVSLAVELAQSFERSGRYAEAVAEYQSIFGALADVPYEFEKGRTVKASLGAEIKIAELLRAHGRAAYASFDAAAAKLCEAGAAKGDKAALQEVVRQYPNSEALPRSLRKLAELHRSAGAPKEAARYLRDYLARYGLAQLSDPAGALVPQTVADLAETYIAAGMPGPARNAARRLAEFPDASTVKLRERAITPAEASGALLAALPAQAFAQAVEPELAPPLSQVTSETLGVERFAGGPMHFTGPRPLSAAKLIYLADYAGNIDVREADTGKVVWKRKIETRPNFAEFSGDGAVFVSQRGTYCLNAANGKELWRRPYEQKMVNVGGNNYMDMIVRATAGEGVVALASQAGNVEVLDSVTGELVWSRELRGLIQAQGFLLASDAVVALVMNPNKLCVMDLATGATRFEMDAKFDGASWPFAVGGVLVMTGQRKISGFDMRTGKAIWSQDMAGQVYPQYMVEHDGHLVAVVMEGGKSTLSCFDCATGAVRWKSDPFQGWPMSFNYSSGRAIAAFRDNREAKLRSVNLADGKTEFDVALPGGMNMGAANAALAKDYIFVSGINYMLMPMGQGGGQMQRPLYYMAAYKATGELAWRRIRTDRYWNFFEIAPGGLWVGDGNSAVVMRPVNAAKAKAARAALEAEAAEGGAIAGEPLKLSAKLLELEAACEDLDDLDAATRAAARSAAAALEGKDEALFGKAYAALETVRLEQSLRSPARIEVRRSPADMKVDGSLDDWAGGAFAKLDSIDVVSLCSAAFNPMMGGRSGKAELGAWKGPADLSARYALAWSDAGLRVAVEITDDDQCAANSEQPAAEADSLIISVDRSPVGGYMFDANDMETAFSLTGDGKASVRRLPLMGRQAGGEFRGECAILRDEASKRTVYELLISPQELGTDKLAPGTEISISMQVADTDGGKPESSLSIAPTLGGARVPAAFARFRLIDSPFKGGGK